MQNEFAAQMDTTEKKLEQAQIAIGNLAKELGSQLLPVVASGAQGFAGMAGEVLKFASTHPQITRFVTLLAAAKAASIAFSGAMRVLGVEGTTATSALTAGLYPCDHGARRLPCAGCRSQRCIRRDECSDAGASRCHSSDYYCFAWCCWCVISAGTR